MLTLALCLALVQPTATAPDGTLLAVVRLRRASPPPTTTAPPVTEPQQPAAPTTRPAPAPAVEERQERKARAPVTKRGRFKQRRIAWEPPPGSGTPLALVFHGEHVALDVASRSRAFELEPGEPVMSAWPRPHTPWLVRDVDGDGRITSGRELFGSSTLLANGERAAHGFAALAGLDGDGDGDVDARDTAFASLALWRDRDGDRRVSDGEVQSLQQAQVTSLSLAFEIAEHCDRARNCERERGAFAFVDESGRRRVGAVVDVHLATQALAPTTVVSVR